MTKRVFYIKNPYETSKSKVINDFFDDYKNPDFEDVSAFITGGGDGTLINSIQQYKQYGKPFYGLNAGTVGFLMNNVELDRLIDIKKNPNAFNNSTEITFKCIKVLVKQGDIQHEFNAFNEVMIGGDMNAWVHFDINEEDDIIGKFSGGGVIISTPQGSTGINKNNSGTILPLKENLWSITGDKTNRKIRYVITPRTMNISYTSRNDVKLWIDGAYAIIDNPTDIQISDGEDVTLIFDCIKEFIKKRRL